MSIEFIIAIIFIMLILYMWKGYELTLYLIYKRRKAKHNVTSLLNNSQLPPITVVIPTFNEAQMIKHKLDNLLSSDYPPHLMEIIVTDSSSDGTCQIASLYPVKIIKNNEKGKIRAINEAIKACKTNIVVLTDVDAILDKSAIKRLVKSFSEDIGAVGGFIKTVNCDGWLSNIRASYHDFDWKLRELEGLVDTSCSLDGNLMAFKKTIVEEIPINSFADDAELTFLIRRKGYRCIICRNSMAYQIAPKSLKHDIQRMRRIIKLTILTSLRNMDMLFDKKYGIFSFLTFPFRRFFNLLVPFMLLYILAYFSLCYPLLLAIGIAMIIVATIIFFKNIAYYWILLFSLILAWFDIFIGNFKEGGVWDKVR
jgi:cellulose synthase/poly-beta-1,6-N-acetylglucosamine synthase-like glycosyltransferase